MESREYRGGAIRDEDLVIDCLGTTVQIQTALGRTPSSTRIFAEVDQHALRMHRETVRVAVSQDLCTRVEQRAFVCSGLMNRSNDSESRAWRQFSFRPRVEGRGIRVLAANSALRHSFSFTGAQLASSSLRATSEYRGQHCEEDVLTIPPITEPTTTGARDVTPTHDPPPNPQGEPQSLELTPEQSRTVRLCLIAIGVLSVGTWTGIAFSPYLVSNYPLLLIAISPPSRHMVLVAPIVGPWWVLLVGGARTLTFTAVAYILGRSLGEPGLVWLDQHAERFARFVRWLEGFFQRWSYLAVFVFPLGAMAAIAGVAKMKPVAFFACAFAGVMFRLSLLVLLAESVREPLMAMIEWIREYQMPATLVCVALVLANQYRKRRSGQPA